MNKFGALKVNKKFLESISCDEQVTKTKVFPKTKRVFIYNYHDYIINLNYDGMKMNYDRALQNYWEK